MKSDTDYLLSIAKDQEEFWQYHETNRANFEKLVTLINSKVVIPFIGAGISINYGYPGWIDFLRKQAEVNQLPEVAKRIDAHQYEEAASILKAHLQDNGWRYLLEQTFGIQTYQNAPECREIELIPRIFPDLLMTTNFDGVIEALYLKTNGELIERRTPKTTKETKEIYHRISGGLPTLVKLHGDAASGYYIITSEDYDTAYGKSAMGRLKVLPAFLRNLLLTRTLLFLGCSLQEDRTMSVIERAQQEGSMSFALLPLQAEESMEERISQLTRHNIVPIWYPSGENKAVRQFLRVLNYYIKTENQYSIVVAKQKAQELLADGIEKQNSAPTEALFQFNRLESILDKNERAFSIEQRLNYCIALKKAYDVMGYAFEKRKLYGDMIKLLIQKYQGNSLELCDFYVDIGYTYECYHYYRLMLKAVQKANKILEFLEVSQGDFRVLDQRFTNKQAYVYITLGYAYLKNQDYVNARIWYNKAEELVQQGKLMGKSEEAFVYNGLYRKYFDLEHNSAKALESLNKALKIRVRLNDNEDGSLINHIINTYSNIIRILLLNGKTESAADQYTECVNLEKIKNELDSHAVAKQRILSVHGDILCAQGEYITAAQEYSMALRTRKYLNYAYDMVEADLYRKIAGALMQVEERQEEALGYLIHADVIYEKITSVSCDEIRDLIFRLGKGSGYSKRNIEQRLRTQRKILEYRFDDRLPEREEELIRCFYLEKIR